MDKYDQQGALLAEILDLPYDDGHYLCVISREDVFRITGINASIWLGEHRYCAGTLSGLCFDESDEESCDHLANAGGDDAWAFTDGLKEMKDDHIDIVCVRGAKTNGAVIAELLRKHDNAPYGIHFSPTTVAEIVDCVGRQRGPWGEEDGSLVPWREEFEVLRSIYIEQALLDEASSGAGATPKPCRL
jgi:hypothetical protein